MLHFCLFALIPHCHFVLIHFCYVHSFIVFNLGTCNFVCSVLNMTCKYYCLFHVPTYVCLFFSFFSNPFLFFVVLYFSGIFFPIFINRLAKSSNKCKVFQVLYLLLLLLLFFGWYALLNALFKTKKERTTKESVVGTSSLVYYVHSYGINRFHFGFLCFPNR